MEGEDAVPAARVHAGESAGGRSGKREDEANQVRQLRSRFVQALLLLRRGARAESLVLWKRCSREPYEYFKGGAQLFSEFGLGLRRLGFAPLALAAHKRALEFAPKDERILFNIARATMTWGCWRRPEIFGAGARRFAGIYARAAVPGLYRS